MKSIAIISGLSLLLTSTCFYSEGLGDRSMMKAASREEAISDNSSFLKKHRTDKLMERWALSDDKTTEVVGIMYLAGTKCYIVGSMSLGDLGYATPSWAKNWAPQMVFYENENGNLERLNYMPRSTFADVSTEDEGGKLAIDSYKRYLKKAKLEQKNMTRQQSAEIFVYGVAYGELGNFSKLGWRAYDVIATSDDYYRLLQTLLENKVNFSEEQKLLLDALKKDNNDKDLYVIYANNGIGYVKCSFRFSKENVLKSVKIQERKSLSSFAQE